jgi:hypothetical protein
MTLVQFIRLRVKKKKTVHHCEKTFETSSMIQYDNTSFAKCWRFFFFFFIFYFFCVKRLKWWEIINLSLKFVPHILWCGPTQAIVTWNFLFNYLLFFTIKDCPAFSKRIERSISFSDDGSEKFALLSDLDVYCTS